MRKPCGVTCFLSKGKYFGYLKTENTKSLWFNNALLCTSWAVAINGVSNCKACEKELKEKLLIFIKI